MASNEGGAVCPAKRKGIFFAAAVLLIVCVLAVGAVSASVHSVYDYDELANAINSASAEDTIYIEDNITVPGDRSLSISTSITLSPTEKNVSISREGAATANQNGMFTIQEEGSLTIQGIDSTGSYTLTLDGKKDDYPNNEQTLVWINGGGSFTLEEGGILTNNSVTGTGQGGTGKNSGAVYVNGGTFEMNGGTISGNDAGVNGGGVFVVEDGTFEMKGGTISGNSAETWGGGICITDGTFTMNGGTISGNSAHDQGNDVYVSPRSTFTLGNGVVAKNPDATGYSVYVEGTFNVQNTGTADSVYLSQGKVIAISGSFSGKISGIMPENRNIDTVIVDLSTFGSAQSLDYFSLDDTLTDLSLKYNEAGKNLVLTTYHTVTFNANGGTLVSDQTVEHNTCAQEPDDPARDDHTFAGWHEGASFITLWDFAAPVTKDLILHAKWIPNKPEPEPPSGGGSSDGNMDNAYRVLFNDGAATLYVVTDLSAGDKLTKPEDPVKDGYTFAGWHKDTACTQPWDFNDGITGDMTLYAKWTPQETVTPTATATPTVTATATATTTPTGNASPAPTVQPDNNGNNGDTTNGETTKTSGISLSYLIGGILILLLAILLLLILLLRHTVTFLIPTGGEITEHRIKVWHGRYINTEDLPALIRTAAWYRDPARQERWDFNEDRVTKSIELYLG
ncbi:MAG TPA: InlB B-repeat-containing protein [Methanocorpusculum sp.]|nr:InlB B-repeat-containing protein [Methanocorpusculum sp.]HJK69012.1 InlB B-repeat-containing protein [Methanocorpusculum sp.]HJK74165.1 InlB B-repeat-containing protein [Methanocorpusculum sp.]